MIEEILGICKTAQKVSEVISPCFKRGEYKKILDSARCYQALESSYGNMIERVSESTRAHGEFLISAIRGNMIHKKLNEKSISINDDLRVQYDSI